MHMNIFFGKQQKYSARKIYLYIFTTYALNAPKINDLYMKKKKNKKPSILKFLENLGEPLFTSNYITLH